MPRLTLDDLYRLAVPSDPQVRPGAAAVAYTLTSAVRDGDENVSEIWLAAPGAEPRRLATGTLPRWSPDGRTLAFVRPVDGKPQIHLLPMDGGEPRVLTAAPLGAGAAVWSPDGREIAYGGPHGTPDPHAPVVADRLDYKADGAGLLRGITMQVFVVDTGTGESRRLTEDGYHADGPSWSPDGRQIAFTASMEPDRDLVPSGAVYVVDSSGGQPKRLTTPDVVCVAAWWLDGQVVAAAFAGGPAGHTRLFAAGQDGQEEIVTGLDRNIMIGAPAYPGAPPRRLDGDLVFCARDRGFTHLYRLRGARAEKIGDPELSVSGMHVCDGRLAYVAASPYSAGEVYLDGERLTSLAPADLELHVPRSRTFVAPDGTEVEGFLTGPADGGPLLLDIHGGPHNAWAPVFDGVHLYHQVLASRGWTVLALNPRASDGYGEAFYTAAQGGWGVADAQDFHAALDELVADGSADPERLAVTGYSYGGYMTCYLTAHTDRFKAAIPGGIVSDLTSMAGTSDAGYYLKMWECSGDMTPQSPLTRAGDVSTPTLILHGENDDRCPIGQAEQWFAALREREVPVRLVRYPGGSHLFIVQGRPSHRYDYNERIIAWLEQWVSGSPN
ncbi:S9 family peptidase [Nonomuraea typhae]|uniref:S9 family peptidase n=1 Tax=Nonomuraea typhae TaxID=2603600 RepID=UPI0012F9D315|nr:S9 family peptidase [Nonomuraea typhae]